VSKLDPVCGIGTYGRIYDGCGAATPTSIAPSPIYRPFGRAEFEHDLPAFNTPLTTQPAPAVPDCSVLRCFDAVCVAQQEGACQEIPVPRFRRPMSLPDLAPTAAGSVR
jgi:hypothetical protein